MRLGTYCAFIAKQNHAGPSHILSFVSLFLVLEQKKNDMCFGVGCVLTAVFTNKALLCTADYLEQIEISSFGMKFIFQTQRLLLKRTLAAITNLEDLQ